MADRTAIAWTDATWNPVEALARELAALRRVRDAAQAAYDEETDLGIWSLTETRALKAALEAARG